MSMLKGAKAKIYRNEGGFLQGTEIWVNVDDPTDVIHGQFSKPIPANAVKGMIEPSQNDNDPQPNVVIGEK